MTREEAFKKAINIVAYFEAHFAKSKEAREEAANIIEVLEQEPKTGHWIDEGIYADGQNYHAFMCSECEWHYIGNKSELVDFKYCPFCRAKMQEASEGSDKE